MNGRLSKALLLAGVIACFACSALLATSFSQGPNSRNASVDTLVNITDSLPEVLGVIVEGGASNITLNAGTYRRIECNASVRDYNGGATITNVSATFFHAGVTSASPDDNNTHYTNASCAPGAASGYDRNFSCSFAVQYYANASAWTCNVTATDDYDFQNTTRQRSNSNTTFIGALLALNVTTLIDYGDLAVGDTSDPQQANVTNLGNQRINVSVYGYAQSMGDGLAMRCEVGNISIENEKYNLVGGLDLAQYANLSGTSTQIGGLAISHQVNDTQPETNTTYWILHVPPNPFGVCNGTVVFQAESS